MTISINGIDQSVPSKEDYGRAVQDITALKAIGPSERFDKQHVYVEDQVRPYYFDLQSVTAESLPDIVEPDDAPAAGRWIKLPQMMGPPAAHASTHKGGGVDEIAAVTGALNGLMTSADKTKLDTVATNADVTGDNPPQAHVHSHASTTGQTADDHHAKSHAHDGADGSGTVAHGDTTGQGIDDHHAKLHAGDHVTGGADVVADVVAAGNSGLMSGVDKTKLDTVDTNADVTGDNPPQAHTHSHASTTGQGTDDHHAKSHAHDGADGSGTVAHGDITGQGTDDHHAKAHSGDHDDGGSDEIVAEDLASAAAANEAVMGDGSGGLKTELVVRQSDIADNANAGRVKRTGGTIFGTIKDATGESADPTTGDDNTQGYEIGSIWLNTTGNKAFIALDVSTGAAVWLETTGAGGGAAFPTLVFMADMLSLPNSADWTVNALAPLDEDPVNDGFPAILYDDASEEGRGLEFFAPAATNIKITTVARAAVAPGGAVVAKMRVYNRGIKLTPAAIEAWSGATNLTDIALPITTRFPHYDVSTITFASLGITAGELTQLEITRNGADGGDTLVNDLALVAIIVEFT